MSRGLIITGLLLLGAGLLWPWLSQLPLGRLPGDIRIERPGYSFYFPITTGLLLSLLISLLLWLLRR
jgi:hypothetical protein